MPYIKPEDRKKFRLEDTIPTTEGELNYCITTLCLNYLKNKTKNYATLNGIIGVLSCAQIEFYRKIIADYENIKIAESGDVYQEIF